MFSLILKTWVLIPKGSHSKRIAFIGFLQMQVLRQDLKVSSLLGKSPQEEWIEECGQESEWKEGNMTRYEQVTTVGS